MKSKPRISILLLVILALVFAISLVFLFFGRQLAKEFHVIGIRVATLFVTFATFASTSFFSYLIFNHNKVMRETNSDANKRAELFREMQFSSANYAIVDFFDGMTIDKESTRYIDKYIKKGNLRFHMIEQSIDEQDVINNPDSYCYLTIKIPYRVVDSKPVASIIFDRLTFERNNIKYRFQTPKSEGESFAFLLYNECTQTNNAIINLIIKKDSDFFSFDEINEFTKIKIRLRINSLLGVEVKGISELYFTNPERSDFDGGNTYKINSSMFLLGDMPKLSDFTHYKSQEK
ncbi:MAG: hypothetical protein GX242_05845 [Clostridiales bacterium]|nr:hypothetical protein [Clostridiales bacterium]